MAGSILKKRSRDEEQRQRPVKRSRKIRKQRAYHSSSEEEDEEEGQFQPVNLAEDDDDDMVETNIAQAVLNTAQNQGEDMLASEDEAQPGDEPEDEDASERSDNDEQNGIEDGSDSGSDASTQTDRRKRKRNDPDAFATSITKILGSKLSTAKREDPVLSRSKAASEVQQARTESKLEEKAKRKMREDKKKASEQGRIRDVLAGEEEGLTAQAVAEREKRLRKTAQRGVVKLFNAFAAAHRKAEDVAGEVKRQGVVGIDQREKQVQSMSKEAFLDLVASGGKAAKV